MNRRSGLFLVVVQALSCLAAYVLLRCDDSGPIEELHFVLPLVFTPVVLQFFLVIIATGRNSPGPLTTYAVSSVIACFMLNQVLMLFWARWQGVGEGVIAISAYFAIYCIVSAALFLMAVAVKVVSLWRKKQRIGQGAGTVAC